MKSDRIVGLIWFALGSGMAIESINLGLGTLQAPRLGMMPFIVGLSLGLCGLTLSILVTLKVKAADDIWHIQRLKKVALPIISLLIYCFIVEYLGFLLTTFLFEFFLLKLTAPKKWLNPLLSSLAIVISCYFIFSLWLNVTLPRGLLGIG